MYENRSANILHSFRLPAYNEIPDVGLYLDQVVKYINSFFSDFPEMNVTPSMISNYVKLKIISSPHKKTYSRDQIAGFIFVVCVKTVLSMDNIRECLSMVPTFPAVEDAYRFFTDKMQIILDLFDEEKIEYTGTYANETEAALTKIVIAVVHKMYLERYFALRAQEKMK